MSTPSAFAQTEMSGYGRALGEISQIPVGGTEFIAKLGCMDRRVLELIPVFGPSDNVHMPPFLVARISSIFSGSVV